MAKTFAIPDLHGRFDLLEKCYEYLRKQAATGATIVHLGDYVDRGPNSRQIIEFLMNPATIPAGFERICLKGNHEAMMVETLRAPLNPRWWLNNGGGETLISYGHERIGEYKPEVVPAEHIDWMNNLPLMHVDEHRVFVHAWVDSSIPLNRQKEEKVLWEIYPHNARYGHRLTGRHVAHGHHQHEDGPKLYSGRSNLDTGAFYTGRIVIAVFDNEKAGAPIEIMEIKGEPDPRYGK